MNEYYISNEVEHMDLKFIHSYLSGQSYWASGRSMDQVKKSIENSLCFGLFNKERQLGFARISTDYVVFAWLMDFFVDSEYREKGLGKMLLEAILNHTDLQEVNGIGLRTQDAQGLYRKYGFGAIPEPETWMYKKNK